jgi:hypothetical protein
MALINKRNVRALEQKLKALKIKSGPMNEDQLTSTLLFALDRTDHPQHNFAVAVARGVLGAAEGLPASGVVKEQTLEDFFV